MSIYYIIRSFIKKLFGEVKRFGRVVEIRDTRPCFIGSKSIKDFRNIGQKLIWPGIEQLISS